jgi:GntR family transcriptional regulator / MocR family aminotransferase
MPPFQNTHDWTHKKIHFVTFNGTNSGISTMISDIQFDRSRPLQTQLYEQLAERILSGRYRAGQRLPSGRECATRWGVSRNTVNAVFDQLRAEGLLLSRRGSGWYVHHDLPSIPRSPEPPRALGDPTPIPRLSRYGRRLQELGGAERSNTSLPLTPGIADLTAFPVRTWNRIRHHYESRRPALGFESYQGLPLLREALADYLRSSRGLRCTSEQILITHGAQQAIALIAQVLLDPDESVLMENPGYGGARRAFAGVSARIRPVPVGPQGLAPERLPETPDARLLYCTPTHQYPLGGIVPTAQRLQLLEWARRNSVWIVEDDYDSEFHFYQKPIPAMQGLVDNAPVIYVGSFSKTLFPALRLGYLVAPEPLLDVLVAGKCFMSGESPQLPQYVAAEFVAQGFFARHLRRMRQVYREKWELCMALWRQELDGRLEPVAQSAGMHLVFRGECDDETICNGMRMAGYGTTPLSGYYCTERSETGFVVGYANARPAEIVSGMQTLARQLGAR